MRREWTGIAIGSGFVVFERDAIEFEAMIDQLVAEPAGDLRLQLLDLLVGELDHLAVAQIDQVIVVAVAHLLVAGAALAEVVTLDDAGNSWLFFGTGRYFSAADKANMDRQHLVGVKDKVVAGTCPSGGPPVPAQTLSGCLHNNLTNVTGVTVSGSTVTGASSSTFSGLLTDISATDGWVIYMAAGDSSAGLGAERIIVNTTLIGGALFAPTFVPYTDTCTASGKGYIYATYYKSGTGYPEPILTDSSGTAQRRVYVGEGVASSVSIQIGAEPTGMAGYIQSSNSLLNKLTPNAPSTVWSQYLSWNSERA